MSKIDSKKIEIVECARRMRRGDRSFDSTMAKLFQLVDELTFLEDAELVQRLRSDKK